MRLLLLAQDLLDRTRVFDFLALLMLRLYLFPIFVIAGWRKLQAPEATIGWFEKSLQLPFPTFMYWLATLTEFLGAFLLLLGFCTRWISLPLMFTMAIAAYTVHWENGWYTVAQTKPNPVLLYSEQEATEVKARLDRGRQILRRHGNYAWLSERGNFVILGNGVELSITYLFMLLVLFFFGAGRYCSMDYWIKHRIKRYYARSP